MYVSDIHGINTFDGYVMEISLDILIKYLMGKMVNTINLLSFNILL